MPPRGDYPSSRQDQYMLRFPGDMRSTLKAEAERNNRSLNAEIIGRLEESLVPRNPQGMALAMSLALNIASAIDQVLAKTSSSHQSASAMLSKALSGQGDWQEIEAFTETLTAKVKSVHTYDPPPPSDEPQPEYDISDLEREFASESQKVFRRLMEKHGIETFTPPGEEVDDK
ncbi:MAG: Arc family DNA-binding protein [Devosia sp.]